MGIVINQSFKNAIATYAGFAFGAINTLFLYTNFLQDEYYGLVIYLLSAANILMPLMTFGVQNTFVKFFSTYKDSEEQARFSSLMFFLPLALVIPIGLIGLVAYDTIASFLSKQNVLVKNYVWVIYCTAVAMGYFEVFYAWSKVHLKTVYGNFLKEIFHRVATMVLLFLVFLDYLNVNEFIWALAIVFMIRTLLMLIGAFMVKRPDFTLKFPKNTSEILKYTGLIILAASIANILLEIDKFMIGQYEVFEQVAYYTVAIFIVMVISVPNRAMHQITYPLTAKLMNENKQGALKDLYKRSAQNLFIAGGGVFLLIVLNIGELYELLPEEYGGATAITVVFLVGFAKLTDTLLGNNNAIIFNSDFYRTILFFGVFLSVLTVGLNMVFIPEYGIKGAAMATLIAFLIYNITKLWFVYRKFKIHPFSAKIFKTAILLIVLFAGFYFWNFPFHPILNIALKSALISGIFVWGIINFKLSAEVSTFLKSVLSFKKK